jgi:hypothetical protein
MKMIYPDRTRIPLFRLMSHSWMTVPEHVGRAQKIWMHWSIQKTKYIVYSTCYLLRFLFCVVDSQAIVGHLMRVENRPEVGESVSHAPTNFPLPHALVAVRRVLYRNYTETPVYAIHSAANIRSPIHPKGQGWARVFIIEREVAGSWHPGVREAGCIQRS